jgi:hypothetical protein
LASEPLGGEEGGGDEGGEYVVDNECIDIEKLERN